MKFLRGFSCFSIISLILASLITLVLIIVCLRVPTGSGSQIPAWLSPVSELMLVFVLALEGVYAILHFRQALSDTQLHAFIELMKDISSPEAYKHREAIYSSIRWNSDEDILALHADNLRWKEPPSDKHNYYESEAGFSFKVTMDNDLWKSISYVGEQYHAAGTLLERFHIDEELFIPWVGVAPYRCWQRLQGVIHLERTRRESPRMWHGFELLATRIRNQLPKKKRG